MPLLTFLEKPPSQDNDPANNAEFRKLLAAETRMLVEFSPSNPHSLRPDSKLAGFFIGKLVRDCQPKECKAGSKKSEFHAPFNIGFELTEDATLLADLSELALAVCHHRDHIACITGSACFLKEKSEIADLDFSSYCDSDHSRACAEIADWQPSPGISLKSLKVSGLGGGALATYKVKSGPVREWLLSQWPEDGLEGKPLAVMRNFMCSSVGTIGNISGTSFTVRVSTKNGQSMLSHRYTEVMLSPPKAGFQELSELRRYAEFLRAQVRKALKNSGIGRNPSANKISNANFTVLKGLKRAYALARLIEIDRDPNTKDFFDRLRSLLHSSHAMQITALKRKKRVGEAGAVNGLSIIPIDDLVTLWSDWKQILSDLDELFDYRLNPAGKTAP